MSLYIANGPGTGGGGGTGDVVGPASAINNNIAVFDTTTGKLIKDGGATIASLVPYTGATADLNMGVHEVVTSSVHANSSSGVTIHNTSGQDVALFGAGGGINGTMYGNLSMNTTNKIVNMADPSSAQDGATKAYVDGLVAGLLDYRGAYNASVNTFPASGGSGTAGAVMKGDMWVISNAGTLGGTAVQVGDSLISNVDTPGQTAGNWNILNGNISYVPEDVANKSTTTSLGTSDTLYPTQNATKVYADTKALLAGSISQSFQVSQLEVGHATDTSVTRSAAGVIAVEGVVIPSISSTNLFTNKTYRRNYIAQTTTYGITTTDHVINCTTGTFTVTLPTAVGVSGQEYIIKNTGTGVITVATTSSQTIDGVTTATINVQYESLSVISDGANWIVC